MRKLFAEDGSEVEVLDDKEIEEIKGKASKLEEELKTITDKSVGLKNLRDAISRKDKQIGELNAKLEAAQSKPDNEVEKAKIQSEIDSLDIDKRAENAARRVLLGSELERALSNYSEEEKGTVKKYFTKLSQGEELNLETMRVFLNEAERVAFPERAKTVNRTVGRPPRVEEGGKGFGDTEEGKDFASRMGIKIEPTKK